MSRNYTFAPGEFYHLYARGYDKSIVYKKDPDYRRFIEGLYIFNSHNPVHIKDVKYTLSRGLTSGKSVFDFDRGKTLIDIGAYCLMPNHFHILVKEKTDIGVSKFMQKLMTSYTMYFNKKYERTGSLFSSSFKAIHIKDDSHLKYLFAYIHINPRKIIDSGKLENYPYSSYMDYLSINRSENRVLKRKSFPDYFAGDLKSEIKEWLSIKSELLPEV